MQKTSPPPSIESWDEFVEGLRDLAPSMLSRLPPSLQNDPQTRQEVARLMLESLAMMSVTAVSSDGDHPMFLPWVSHTLNVGQPNSDTHYRMAYITPGGTYRLRGRRGSLRIARIAQFGPARGPAGIATLDVNDINTLKSDANGRYDVIVSPARPANYTGDWWKLDPAAHSLMLRLVAANWQDEVDPTISIERLDVPANRPRRSAEVLEAKLKQLPAATAQMALLLVDHVVALQKEGYVNKLKVFDVSQIGGQLTGQFYYEGAYDLADDEALIIEAQVPDKFEYYSIIVTNEIYETTDWFNNHSSLNDAQLRVDPDGVLRVVVSAKDPGVANWLDTAGNPRGVVQGRWTECNSQPVPVVRKVRVDQVRDLLPSATHTVTLAQRDASIRERRAQLQQRPLW
jgi:Protein of unknown function (DUF1214)